MLVKIDSEMSQALLPRVRVVQGTFTRCELSIHLFKAMVGDSNRLDQVLHKLIVGKRMSVSKGVRNILGRCQDIQLLSSHCECERFSSVSKMFSVHV